MLRKYLYKDLVNIGYDKKAAIKRTGELMHEHKDNLFGMGGLAYSKGKRDFEYFCLHFLQDIFVPKPDNTAFELSDIHYKVWNTLEDMFIKDSFDNLELVMPRGSSKSTTVNFALSVWAHCYEISKYTLVAGKTEQDSTEFIRETRYALEKNPYIIHTFGNLVNPKKYTVNKLEIELSNSTKVQAISSTSSIRGKKYQGFRPSIIIADKLVVA